jgi:hypothetical protein
MNAVANEALPYFFWKKWCHHQNSFALGHVGFIFGEIIPSAVFTGQSVLWLQVA